MHRVTLKEEKKRENLLSSKCPPIILLPVQLKVEDILLVHLVIIDEPESKVLIRYWTVCYRQHELTVAFETVRSFVCYNVYTAFVINNRLSKIYIILYFRVLN